jgi:hypothetical protein
LIRGDMEGFAVYGAVVGRGGMMERAIFSIADM